MKRAPIRVTTPTQLTVKLGPVSPALTRVINLATGEAVRVKLAA